MDDCIFCKIISGKIPSAKVYEDDKTFAFLDINPVNPGHTLIVPKKHSADMLEIADEDLVACIRTAKKLSNAIVQATFSAGVNLGVNTKPAAGQVVFHTHFHIIPRLEKDGLKHWPHKKYESGQMEQVKKDIIKYILTHS